MNTLSSLPPHLLAPSALSSASVPATGGAGAAQRLPSWLDEGSQGLSEPLHVGPNSRARAIEDIERDFVQALCQVDPGQRV
jgi:hypothetical protein